MSIDDVFRIGAPDREGPANPVDPAGDSTEFRRLLERLESLSRPRDQVDVEKAGSEEARSVKANPTNGMDEADDLKDALRRAEDDFVSAMDLRRQLEEAFRRSQS